jgi:hypothetical protein
MAGGQRGLQRVLPRFAAQRLRPVQGREATADEQLVPAVAVLVELTASGRRASTERRSEWRSFSSAVNAVLGADPLLGEGA